LTTIERTGASFAIRLKNRKVVVGNVVDPFLQARIYLKLDKKDELNKKPSYIIISKDKIRPAFITAGKWLYEHGELTLADIDFLKDYVRREEVKKNGPK
jgi:hypothetical protein